MVSIEQGNNKYLASEYLSLKHSMKNFKRFQEQNFTDVTQNMFTNYFSPLKTNVISNINSLAQ